MTSRNAIARIAALLVAAGAVALGFAAPAAAVTAPNMTLVDWTSDASVDGAGAGALGVGSVNYTTAVGLNAGTTLGEQWTNTPATSGALTGGIVNDGTGAVIGANGGGTTQTVTFGHAVTNPLLLLNYCRPAMSFDFGNVPVSLVTSDNAALSGETVTCAGSTGSPSDGFALQLSGTFGPGAPLTFAFGNSSGSIVTAAFTLGVPTSVAVADSPTVTGQGSTTLSPLANDTPGQGATFDVSSVRLLDAGGQPVTSLHYGGGTYVVDTSTGDIAFTPDAGFTGLAAAVNYQVVDSNGLVAAARLEVTVTPVVDTPMFSAAGISAAVGALLLLGFAWLLVRRRRVHAGRDW